VGAAVNYCHGFLMATGQFHTTLTRPGGGVQPMYRLPSPLPTVSDITAAFVTWARANPQYAGESAVEGVVRFATAASPCPPPAHTARRPR